MEKRKQLKERVLGLMLAGILTAGNLSVSALGAVDDVGLRNQSAADDTLEISVEEPADETMTEDEDPTSLSLPDAPEKSPEDSLENSLEDEQAVPCTVKLDANG